MNLTLLLKTTDGTSGHNDADAQHVQTKSAQHTQLETPQPLNNLLDLLRSVMII